MQIRKRNKNNQKRLYDVSLEYIIYTKLHNNQFLYNDRELSKCLVYAYNKNEAMEKAKQYMEYFEYPVFFGYKLEYSEIMVRNFKTLMIGKERG